MSRLIGRMGINRDLSIGQHASNRLRRGQSAVLLTIMTPVMFGLAGLTFDIGTIYVRQTQLNASTQAAVLAGAQAMAQSGATSASVSAAVTNFSSASGNRNASPFIAHATVATGYPQLSCLSTLKTLFSVYCYGPSSANALVVKQTATEPMMFLRMFGADTVTVSATATASMKGNVSAPINMAIVLDTTQSMNSTDLSANCLNTRINCALGAVATMLKTIAPCPPGYASCGTATNGNVANSVDRVSLFAFPPVTTSTAVDDYNCGVTNPTTTSYTYPLPASATYQIVGYSSDYRTSFAATSLNTSSSHLAKAVAGGLLGAPCVHVVGGHGTYYAQAIYSAQATLVAEQSLFPNSKNVMVIIGDGDAGATSSNMPGASTTSTVYMSTKQQCHQAVTAAAAATAAGTTVYSVAYGAAASGCSSDTSPTMTPCQTMSGMASTPGTFFSDYTATGGSASCTSTYQPVTSLTSIFKVIANDLTVSKLIPNGTL